MNIVHHPLCTTVIGAPADMQDGSCSGLPVAYDTDKYGTWANSFWKPDADELAEITAGGGIMLSVRAHGRQHPVISMSAYPNVGDAPMAKIEPHVMLAPERPEETPELQQMRAEFEDAALSYAIERRGAGGVIGDNGCPFTKESLFWRQPTGEYGVLMFNAAWWAWQSAMKKASAA